MFIKVNDLVDTYVGKGVVVVIDRYNSIGVKLFEFKTGHSLSGVLPRHSTNGWWFSREDITYLGKYIPEPDTKYSKIIAKIKYLDKKFKERNLNGIPF